jgi:outer membrane protein TolC
MVTAGVLLGQEPLTLKESVRQALANHPSQEAAQAGLRAAQARVEQARAAYWPKASYRESFQSSNQPVFAFGALLNQRRFAQEDFAIGALNHPGFVNNFQSQISAEQTVWDFGATGTAIRSAEIGGELSAEEQRFAAQQRIAAVARAYHAVTLAEQARGVAEAAVRSGEADLSRAEAVRVAGMSTDADVLSIRVHVASVREQEIRRRFDAEVALAALNEAMGAALEMQRRLSTPLRPVERISAGRGTRPELRQVQLAGQLRQEQRAAASKAYYPQIVAQTVFEANRGRFVVQGGASWYFSAGLRWNLFDASSRRKIQEAEYMIAAAHAQEKQVTAGIALESKRAEARFASAAERLRVTEAAVAQAEESVRIVRNRYEAGLARIDELLRNEAAVLEAQLRRLQAVYDQRIAAVEVELAAGTLTEASDVLE